jgi:hypothetical protein
VRLLILGGTLTRVPKPGLDLDREAELLAAWGARRETA